MPLDLAMSIVEMLAFHQEKCWPGFYANRRLPYVASENDIIRASHLGMIRPEFPFQLHTVHLVRSEKYRL
jgi:hypothetical protein